MEKYELKHKDYNSIMDIPNLSGCFMFVRTHVFDMIGYFDERYFIYLEDTDLCRRINLFYRTIYYPTISITHGYSKASYDSFRLMKHHLISSLKYFSKWGWFSDSTRNKINKAVLDNRLMPVLESERIKRRSLLNDKQKKASLKSRSLQEPVIGMVVPFELLNVSA
jgi:GT2 family glycosyltransferase